MSKPTGIANITTAIVALLACTAFCFTIFGTNWVHTSTQVVRNQMSYDQEGLWKKCRGVLQPGQRISDIELTCDSNYASIRLSDKPIWLVMNQFLIPIAAGLTCFAVITSILGHPVMTKFNMNPATMIGMTAVFISVAGICGLVGTSYCVNAAINNKIQVRKVPKKNPLQIYSNGWCSILAMITSILCILWSIFTFKKCADRKSDDKNDDYTGGREMTRTSSWN